MHAFRSLLAAAALFAATNASAADSDCTPRVRDGWLRLPPMSMPMLAGFGRIDNNCATPATIVSASSPAFDSVELHETRIVDGISRMRAVPQLRLPPHGTATMKPGGLHLMLMQPRAPLQAGSRVAVEFTLADGRKLFGEFEVRKPDAR
jgi:periplasmic copper chaperone A